MENSNAYFRPLIDELLKTDFHLRPQIKDIEKRILHGTSQFPNDLLGLVAFLLSQIMLGEKAKAVTIAKKIWEIGGKISPADEVLYTDCLINLGLKEMAEILLKPRYEKFDENFEYFSDVMEKFALQQGDTLRLAKINAVASTEDKNYELSEILSTYQQLDMEDCFTNTMKIIFEHSYKHALAYEYVFYSDRGFAEVEVVIYTNQDAENGQKFENYINQKIDAYYTSINKKRLNNIFVSVLMISEHFSIEQNGNETKEETPQNMGQYNPSDWGF